jgi:tetratricopeptide (TPR) repeat protein
MEGMEALRRLENPLATDLFFQAAALDTAFLAPLLYAGFAAWNRSEFAQTDSLAVEALRRGTGRRSPFESQMLASLRAMARGNWNAAYRANQELSRFAPESGFTFNVALNAYYMNRPRDAIAWARTLDPDRGAMRGYLAYPAFLTQMYHAVGDHRRELRLARRSRRQAPDNRILLSAELRAVAARGDHDRVSQLLEESLAMPGPGPSYLVQATMAGLELRAHGHPAQANEILQRAIQAHRSRGARSVSPGDEAAFARLLYTVDELEAARDTFLLLLQQSPRNVGYKGYVGIAAAGLKDRATALRVDQELAALDGTFLQGSHTFFRAQIAAALGDNPAALRLLQEAFWQGMRYDSDLHRTVAFEPLRDDSVFQRILRPKG